MIECECPKCGHIQYHMEICPTRSCEKCKSQVLTGKNMRREVDIDEFAEILRERIEVKK